MILQGPKGRLDVEVAESWLQKAKGLSFRRSLPKDGMLFPFGRECRQGFWMFGMSFGIDIIFLNDKKTVSEVHKAEPMSLHPRTWKVYYPEKPIRYVLETRAGSGIRKGDGFRWNT